MMKLRQIETGTKIGGILTLLQRCQFYFSLLNFLMILATFYYTTLRHILSIPFLVFAVGMAGALFALMVIEYVVIYPSFVAFQMHQAYKRNPLVRDVEEVKKEVKELRKIVERILLEEVDCDGR